MIEVNKFLLVALDEDIDKVRAALSKMPEVIQVDWIETHNGLLVESSTDLTEFDIRERIGRVISGNINWWKDKIQAWGHRRSKQIKQ